ncbi:MAG: hypothetical protein ACE5HD_01155 [Acidobacteriota bacterium]
MVALTSLLLPIVLAAVLVFVASSFIHMVLPFHRSDFHKLPAEDNLMEAMRQAAVVPGDYVMPCAGTPANMRTPEFQEKVKKGPVAFITVLPAGFAMGKSLVLWFLYSLLVGVFSGYVAGHTLAPGTEYITVFRLVATVAFMGYSLALWQNSIWYKRPWITTLKHTVDGLLYGLLTGGSFGWLWP